MRSLALAFLMVLLAAPALPADGLEKAYFASTLPGTWAKQESNWQRPDGMSGTNTFTWVRAPDNEGRVCIEVVTETLAGPGEGMISRQLFVMEPGFDLATSFLDHTAYLEASVAQVGDGPASLMQQAVIEILRESGGGLTSSVTFLGRTTLEGRECDRYAYSYTSGGPHATDHEGEICLDETLPFGVVVQTGRVTDAQGTPVSSFEQRLLESGTGRSATAALLALTPAPRAAGTEPVAAAEAPRRVRAGVTLLEAYQGETIDLLVEVEPGSGGRRLELRAVNKTESDLELAVPAGSVTIPADSPLGALQLVFGEESRFSLSPGESSPRFSAEQLGGRGVTGGNFRLTVYEGELLFQGTVDVGPLP